MRRQPGQIALLRYRRLGPVSYADPVTVVKDEDDLIMLYQRPGTPIKVQTGPGGLPIPRDISYRERAALPRQVGGGTYKWNHTLILIRPGDAYDTRLFWPGTDWTFRGWYVNLQRPVRRSSVGFDTADHFLDIFVKPNLAWIWKDGDEMAQALEIRRFTEAGAAEIRREGERVIARVETRSSPFDSAFDRGRPDPASPVPAMPENWNVDQ